MNQNAAPNIDEDLPFIDYINTLKQKLNRANSILAKLKYYVTADILETIYYALFDSHMRLIFDMIDLLKTKL